MDTRVALAVLAGVLTSTIHAQDWPQWRGPSRDAVVPAAAAPASWPASFARAWRVDVGEGYSSPVVAGGRVFVHSRADPIEIVTAIDLTSGKVVWQKRYEAPFAKNQYAARMAKGPHATPLVAGSRVFTLGVTGLVIAWDAATGAEVWRHDYSGDVDTSKLFCGTAASPVLVNGSVIVQVGSDVRGGRILALDPATGQERWTWKGPGPGYASPAIVTLNGVTQIVTLTNQSVLGLDAATGRQLWTFPFADEWHENIVTPAWTGELVIVSGPRQGTRALRIAREGETWTAREVWHNAPVTMYMSTPVTGDGLVYGMSSKQRGQFVALRERTGEIAWATQGREGEYASILLAPRHVLFLANNGKLSVARRGETAFQAERVYQLVEGETWAMPVVLGRDLIVRDATGIMRLTGAGS